MARATDRARSLDRPRPVRTDCQPDYPALAEYVCSRRSLIAKLALGLVSAGVGNGLLAGCADPDAASREDGSGGSTGERDAGMDFDELSNLPGAGAPAPRYPEVPFQIRLPRSGFAHTRLLDDGSLTYAVSLTETGRDLEPYVDLHEEEALEVLGTVLSAYRCDDLYPRSANLDSVQEALFDAVVSHAARKALWFSSGHLVILVERCVTESPTGGEEDAGVETDGGDLET